jgi:hypothetical protein
MDEERRGGSPPTRASREVTDCRAEDPPRPCSTLFADEAWNQQHSNSILGNQEFIGEARNHSLVISPPMNNLFKKILLRRGLSTAAAQCRDERTVGKLGSLVLCAAEPELLLATPYKIVDVGDEASQKEGIDWWGELTAFGGEGMVVKPLQFIGKNRRGLIRPAIKCRGRGISSDHLRAGVHSAGAP